MVETLFEVISLFEEEEINYCLIGGLAVMLYGGRANTIDMDFYVLVNDLEEVKKLFRRKKIPAQYAGEHQIKARHKGIPIGILWADYYLGANVVQRAKRKKLGKKKIKIATPEDLIILKTLADRSIDRRDIEELKELFGKKLDEEYMAHKLKHLRKILK